MTGDPIFKPKIEQRVNYVFTFCAWQGGIGELKYTDNERWGMVVWKTRYMEHTWSNMYTVYGIFFPKFFPMTKKCSQNPGFRVHLS